MNASSGDRLRLSVAMIVRDEEQCLPEALASVRSIADEIVVVDTGSRDATLRIAGRHGARAVAVPWQDDFSAARNRALEVATGDWILWLDAGERLSTRCAAPLRSFIDAGPDRNCAWLCMIELPPERPDTPAEQIGRIRLMPRRDDLRFSGRVRETLRPALARANMTVEIGPWHLLRTAREHDAQIKRQRALRDLKLIEREIREQGASPRLLLGLGDCCLALGQSAKAANYYRQTIQTAAPGSTEMLSAYYGLLTTFPADAHPGTAQLQACVDALEVYPYDAQLLCAMAGYLQAQGHFNLAQRSYRAAHQFGQIDPETWHIGLIGEIAAICLSLNLQLLSDDQGALEILLETEKRFPKSPRLARRQLELRVKRGETQEAMKLVERLDLASSEQDLLRSAIRGACQASQKNWIPALAYLETAYRAGCRDSVCLRWYTISLFSTGQRRVAQSVLADWAQVEPACAEMARYRQALVESGAADSPTAEVTPNQRRGTIPAPHMHPEHRTARSKTAS